MFTNEYTIHGSVHLTPPTPLGKNDEFAHVHICDSVYHSLSTATTSTYVHFSHIYNVHITDSSHGPKKGLCPLLDDRSLLSAAVVGDR